MLKCIVVDDEQLDFGNKLEKLFWKRNRTKIDYLLQEYTAQLDLNKLKYELGYIETFVTISLEVLENVVKLNLSKAAKVLFDLSRQDISLLEAEQNLPGKELAFLHKLNNKSRL